MWELFGQFLANETFASEMHISLAPLNDSAIAHVESDPGLKDQFQKPVRSAARRAPPLGTGAASGLRAPGLRSAP